jgi:hypothetical protein
MMKRLVEDESLQDGRETCLAELLRAAGPLRIDPFRKRRILVRLERATVHMASRFWLRPGVAAALLASGSAAAALGQRYVAHTSAMVGPALAPNPRVPAAAPTILRPTATRSAAPSTLAASAEPADGPTLTTSDPLPSSTHGNKSVARLRPESGEDATHVLSAIQALRTERDPVRAQALLDEYLQAHAHGLLSGDALALSIEAAAARRDPRAADYARRYLAAYPKGKYRALATRALEMRASKEGRTEAR